CDCLVFRYFSLSPFFSFTDTPPTEIYTLSLHDALPISAAALSAASFAAVIFSFSIFSAAIFSTVAFSAASLAAVALSVASLAPRSEEHTSELQSLAYLVCRLLLEKKKKK